MFHNTDTYETAVAAHSMTTAEYESRARAIGGFAPLRPASLSSRLRDALQGGLPMAGGVSMSPRVSMPLPRMVTPAPVMPSPAPMGWDVVDTSTGEDEDGDALDMTPPAWVMGDSVAMDEDTDATMHADALAGAHAMLDCLEPFGVWGDVEGDTLTLYAEGREDGCTFTAEECARPLRAMYTAQGFLGYRAAWGDVVADWRTLFA